MAAMTTVDAAGAISKETDSTFAYINRNTYPVADTEVCHRTEPFDRLVRFTDATNDADN